MSGTRKAGFLAFSDLSRKNWELKGPVSKGIEISHINIVLGSLLNVLFVLGFTTLQLDNIPP